MKYRSFIWDFDGTLFDSYPHIAAAFEKLLDECGISYTHDEVLALFSVSNRAVFDRYSITDAQAERFYDYERVLSLRPVALPFDGAAALLSAIVENGGENFLYTHRDASALAYLRLFGLDKYFRGIVDSTMHFPDKPAPDAIEYLCRAYRLNRADTVMIGDREIDIGAAVACGVSGALYTDDSARIAATAAAHHASDMFSLSDVLEIPLREEDRPAARARFLKAVQEEATAAAEELCREAHLTAGQTVVIGCSTSEVIGAHIGRASAPDIAEAIFTALYDAFSARGIHLAAQCCEHLNRALVIDRAAYRSEGTVNAVPMPKAGGAFAAAAYRRLPDPILIGKIRADAGLDIGGTMIGMHLKRVAVPLRLSVKTVGAAALSAARVRPPFVGGERAAYDASLL